MNLRTIATLVAAALALSACDDDKDINRDVARRKDRKRRAARVLALRVSLPANLDCSDDHDGNALQLTAQGQPSPQPQGR